MQSSDPRELLGALAKILRKLKIPYIVTGGIAVLVWGRPRYTADIDIVIELEKNRAEAFREALLSLGKAGHLDYDVMMEALASEGEFNFIHGESGVKVDFWVLKKHDDFDTARLKRKKVKIILGEKINFISPEDLILVKLKWHKESGSARQLEDVESILKISGEKLDIKYLKTWTTQFDVDEIFGSLSADVCFCGSEKKYKKCHGR